MSFDPGRVAKLNYVIALYDNNLTIEIRDNLKQYINNLEGAMEIFGEMITVFKQAILDHKIDTPEAVHFIATEYEYLGLNNYLDYRYVGNFVVFNLYLYRPIGYNHGDLYNMMHESIEYADEASDNIVKTDVYCTMIKVIDRYNAVTVDLEFTRKVLDYYNSLSEEERKISIFPGSLVAL